MFPWNAEKILKESSPEKTSALGEIAIEIYEKFKRGEITAEQARQECLDLLRDQAEIAAPAQLANLDYNKEVMQSHINSLKMQGKFIDEGKKDIERAAAQLWGETHPGVPMDEEARNLMKAQIKDWIKNEENIKQKLSAFETEVKRSTKCKKPKCKAQIRE